MPHSDREIWLLNLYRNSELQGALLMGRLARHSADSAVLQGAMQHCATEARHAALLTDLILGLGAAVDPGGETIQQRYSQEGGIPKELAELLVLSEVLEGRVLSSYREHLQRSDINPEVRRVLQMIIREEEAHSGQQGWAEQVLAGMAAGRVGAAREKWKRIDEKVAADLHQKLETMSRAGEANP